MEEPKWEELDMDCLVNIFARVGMESLLLYVPFVCKSWLKATHQPLCWQSLFFPQDMNQFIDRLKEVYEVEKFDLTKFIISVVDRSERTATKLMLPPGCTSQALYDCEYKCPALKVVFLQHDILEAKRSIMPYIICSWRNLEVLRLESSYNMEKIVTKVGQHCKNFHALIITRTYIWDGEASAIVDGLPSIRFLVLHGACLKREHLVMILQGCKELVYLDVRECKGFEADEEILKLASHIRTFEYEGSTAEMQSDYDEKWLEYHDWVLEEYCDELLDSIDERRWEEEFGHLYNP